jgi:uncharacterized membrane protein
VVGLYTGGLIFGGAYSRRFTVLMMMIMLFMIMLIMILMITMILMLIMIFIMLTMVVLCSLDDDDIKPKSRFK